MHKIVNHILNKILGVTNRYKAILQAGESRFLPGFNINTNKVSGIQNHKVIVGNHCLLGVTIHLETPDAKVLIGDRVYIGNSSIISKTSVSFGNDILVAWGVTFYDHDSHSLDRKERDVDVKVVYHDFINEKGNYLKNKDWSTVNSAPIRVDDHAWIGADALILKGVTIGEGAVVGARSVVTKDVPPYTVVAGNPAKVIKHLENIYDKQSRTAALD